MSKAVCLFGFHFTIQYSMFRIHDFGKISNIEQGMSNVEGRMLVQDVTTSFNIRYS